MREYPYKSVTRILCVFSTLDRGGAETMCMNLYRHINREEIQLDFIKHTSKTGAYEDEIKKMGGRIYEAPRYKLYNHIKYCRWWKNYLRKHPEYKIIHGHFFTISAIYFKIAKKYGRITVGHSHCTEPDKNSLKAYLLSYLCKKVDKYSDVRLACSKKAGNWIYKKDFIVLNNAIETKRFVYNAKEREKVRNAFNLQNRFVIGTIGRIMHQKNPLGVIEIFKAIRTKRPDALLMWVGDGPMRIVAENKVKEYGLKDSVLFLGVRADVPSLLQAMDAFILPSFYEGLPVVAIEAQASGLPCYISDTVTREVDITGLCMFLPINDEMEWCKSILEYTGKRVDTSIALKKAGYDICDTANWLEHLYLKLNKVRRQ